MTLFLLARGADIEDLALLHALADALLQYACMQVYLIELSKEYADDDIF